MVDPATCAAVVFDNLVALDGVPRARTSGVCGILQETQGSREIMFLLNLRRCASFIDGDMGVYDLDSRAATVSRRISALLFSSEWPGCQRFHRG